MWSGYDKCSACTSTMKNRSVDSLAEEKKIKACQNSLFLPLHASKHFIIFIALSVNIVGLVRIAE